MGWADWLTKHHKLLQLIRRVERPLSIGVAALAIALILFNFEFTVLEARLYDLRMSRGQQPKPDSNIAVVMIDDTTLKGLDEFSPLPLDLHVQFLENLEKLHPRAVGYIVDFNQVNQANPDLFLTDWATRLVQSAQRMEAAGVPVILGTPFDVTGELIPPYPLSSLQHSVALIHRDGNVFAEDKVSRRALSYLNDAPVFHMNLAQRIGAVARDYTPRGTFHLPQVDGDYFFFRYHGSTVFPPGSDPKDSPYPMVSFIDVLRGQVQPNALKDKVVLVGTASRDDSRDFAFTPYSRQPQANPSLLVHANVLDSIINEHSIVRMPWLANLVIGALMTALVLAWVLQMTPLYGVFSTLGLGIAFLVASQLLFQWSGWWIRESQPLICIFVGYYLAVPYRLIREYKQRWEYQRQNELFFQVEELKTNFLSLVTHDLKTPVARIQGLAEVLLRKSSDRLIDRDRETLNNIIGSTEELNRFISSILELNRIESSRVRLELQSRDINQIVEQLMESFKPQAKSRGIELVLRLEPLFPFRFDPRLMEKVLNNLIDNAIKYSPPETQVIVESREVDSWVEISVQDQGIGLSEEERAQLFTKFYRAKNDSTIKIAGTGLGLYLTRYFVESHRGQVSVDSSPGAGSRFTIRLPQNLDGRDLPNPLDSYSASLSGRPGLRTQMNIKIKKVKKLISINPFVKKENSDVSSTSGG